MINISILSFLTRWWVDTFAGLNKAKRVEARAAYLKFAETFTPFIRHLELEDTNLDSLIEEEFPKHDLARYNFMRYLDASCRKRFDEKWLQYKKHYEQIAEVHKQWETVRLSSRVDNEHRQNFARVEALKTEMWNSRDNRRKDLLNVIQKILEIAERKY